MNKFGKGGSLAEIHGVLPSPSGHNACNNLPIFEKWTEGIKMFRATGDEVLNEDL